MGEKIKKVYKQNVTFDWFRDLGNKSIGNIYGKK
jgi:hypothetical protein